MNVRSIELMRAGWGVVLLVAPGAVLTSVQGVQVDRKAVVVARILGARHLVQAILSGVNPSPETLAAGVWVDAVHSMTAFGLAMVDRHRTQAAVVDGIVAASWAGLGLRHVRTDQVQTTPIRTRDQLAYAVVGNLPGGDGLMAQARRIRATRN